MLSGQRLPAFRRPTTAHPHLTAMNTPHLFSTPALHAWVADLWRCAGSSEAEAILTADHLIGANLAGHDSHGVGMVPLYVNSWVSNELQLNQTARVTQDSGSMMTVDGCRGMGQSVTYQAMQLAIERAREHGVCVMGLKHSHHLGRVGHWAEQAIAAGMISVHFVNAVHAPSVAPHGGKESRFLTNPFTVGIPVPGREPMVLDFATTTVALGKVRVAHLAGKQVPPGSLIDADGTATTDPDVMFPAEGATAGALLTFAGHKGYALAMVCEVLGAALTGGDTMRAETFTHAVWNNMLTIVFDPQRMNSSESFGTEARAFIDWVQSSALRQDSPGILMPGDPERASRRARAEFIPLDAATLAQLDEAASTVAKARSSTLVPLSSLIHPQR